MHGLKILKPDAIQVYPFDDRAGRSGALCDYLPEACAVMRLSPVARQYRAAAFTAILRKVIIPAIATPAFARLTKAT